MSERKVVRRLVKNAASELMAGVCPVDEVLDHHTARILALIQGEPVGELLRSAQHDVSVVINQSAADLPLGKHPLYTHSQVPSGEIGPAYVEGAHSGTTDDMVPNRTAPKEVVIEVYQHDWLPGFAAFQEGSLEATGKAYVVLNLGSLLAMVESGDAEASDLPYIVAESIMHEVVHALEEWAGVEFNEERVEALIEKYRATYAQEESDG